MPLSQKQIRIFLLIILIGIAIFFRFWKIREYATFLGDEGRDMIILRNIFVEKHLPFLGPSASVGGFYLGPIYYWMAAPFLLLTKFDPIGPSYMVAIFGVATVLLLYKFLNEIVGFWQSFLVSLLYATAPLIVRYSRSSWNPNPLPFFSLLLIYCVYLGIKHKKIIYFIGAGAAFGVSIQLHYLALILAPLAFFIIIFNEKPKRLPLILVLATTGFVITFSPFLFFEIKHNFPNFRTIIEFVTRGSTVGYQSSNFVWKLFDGGNILLEFISGIKSTIYTRIVFLILSLGSVAALAASWKDKQKKLIFSIGFSYLIIGILLIRSYRGDVYDYYYGAIFPAPFFLAGILIGQVWKKNYFKLIVCFIVAITLVSFLKNSFLFQKPNNLIKQTADISDNIIRKSDGKPFNFALISKSNSDYAYRYFLEIKNHKPTPLEEMVTDQLIVLCESNTCSPLGNSLWEIAGFGRGEIVGEWDLPKYGFKIFRLTHWLGEPSPAGKPAVKGI